MKELYEIFRIEEGVPLFLEDHLNRLFRGAQKSNINLNINPLKIKKYIYNYISHDSIAEGNFRLSFYFDETQLDVKEFRGQSIKPSYPPTHLYQSGIECSLMHAERIHPETKIANTELRNQADERISNNHLFEVILVNRDGRITEGSRSNVFFIKDKKLITAPDDCVLPGVVRKKTIELAKELAIPIDYKCLDAKKELPMMDGAFITGTSPRILPIREIDHLKFDPNNEVLQLLISKLKEKISNYIKENKK
ncbi:aminotransferase class IV [Marinilabilia rubra]|uniref:aminotransferase class IV n=1 Tax=Marinilabilia rubra TaxID=2162893 RepID=UPI001305047E|nr:aminotransferase class IV [Marinilabilia rubra]